MSAAIRCVWFSIGWKAGRSGPSTTRRFWRVSAATLAVTGRLSPEGAAAAIDALTRFRVLIEAAKPDAVFTVATAAVRDAADGPAFCRRVKDRTGLDLRVLSGEEEARYSALGVLAGLPNATGLVGDLGGASLELTRIVDGEPGRGVTLPLGPFSVADGGKPDADKIRAAIERHLRPIAGRFGARSFNAVGGAWRNFALIHMRMSNYPLEIVHEYEIEAQDALEARRLRQPPVEGLPGSDRGHLPPPAGNPATRGAHSGRADPASGDRAHRVVGLRPAGGACCSRRPAPGCAGATR